jgi:hypothetical protein
MFAVKVTEIAGLKKKWQQQRELEAQIERMVSLLGTTSPEIALQVEEMMLMSSRANELITDEDAKEIRKRAATRRSTVHHSTDSDALVALTSISPGGPLPAGDSVASVPQVSQEHPLAGRKVAFEAASGQPSSDESRRDEMAQKLIGLLARHIELMPEKLGPPGFKKNLAIVSEVQLIEWAMEMFSEKLTGLGEASRGSG